MPKRPIQLWIMPASKRLAVLPDEVTVVIGDEHYLVRPRLQDSATGDLHCDLLAEDGQGGWRVTRVVTVPPSFSERTVMQRTRAYVNNRFC